MQPDIAGLPTSYCITKSNTLPPVMYLFIHWLSPFSLLSPTFIPLIGLSGWVAQHSHLDYRVLRLPPYSPAYWNVYHLHILRGLDLVEAGHLRRTHTSLSRWPVLKEWIIRTIKADRIQAACE